MKFSRVVTNVGNNKAVYRAYLENIPTGLRISVKPRTLTFTRKYQTRIFVVSVELEKEFLDVLWKFEILKQIRHANVYLCVHG
ncbi:hypothetical protein CFP56_010188 [Quercus suber]|uniref:Subtilisin-like protease fibronectin type-III domain-containing protein n=1 Tax=Quercus suber TaxID=58331 RepID=A0AAW0L170_QUESU